jgi:hypothetical protein
VIRVALAAQLAASGLLAGATAPVCAGQPEDVQALVERAADYIRQYGRNQAFADFSRPDGGFVNGELYIFCNDSRGVQLANGANPKMVGKNVSAVPDAAGTLTTAEIFNLGQTKGQGWYEYFWPNVVKGRVEHKITFVLRIDEQTICASGYYKPNPP